MPTGFDTHNHSTCVDNAMGVAESYCATHGLNLTKSRKRVLEILLREHKPMGAYDILSILNDEGMGSQPPLVYRALDFLVQHDFAHKLEQRNAYIACAHPGQEHMPIFLICQSCNTVAEDQVPKSDATWSDLTERHGFEIHKTVIEAEGVCPACLDKGAA